MAEQPLSKGQGKQAKAEISALTKTLAEVQRRLGSLEAQHKPESRENTEEWATKEALADVQRRLAGLEGVQKQLERLMGLEGQVKRVQSIVQRLSPSHASQLLEAVEAPKALAALTDRVDALQGGPLDP
eukprot:scaffold232528_cov50-Prasinocladus_malaysianus.AAC.1